MVNLQRLIPKHSKQQLFYPGAVVPLCKYIKIGKRRDKVVLVIPLFQETGSPYPQLDDIDKILIEEFFESAWGGMHHLMILPNELVPYYTKKIERRKA